MTALRVAAQLEFGVLIDLAAIDLLDGTCRIEDRPTLFDAIDEVVRALGAEAHVVDDDDRMLRGQGRGD